ncbi:hypothetical protein C1Y63_07775 [Corynebacterium sp. 13CS0277]|nr:hypothetical protein C1Y63_07775 [Corynebacterium sp. 13CS0277]
MHPRTGGSTRFRNWDSFISSAQVLLGQAEDALAAGDLVFALEYAYQAGLRTAGARTATSPVIARRKRLPSGAWEQLALVGQDSAEWARRLGAYSRTRSRVNSGIERDVDPAVVEELLAAVREFFEATVVGEGAAAA